MSTIVATIKEMCFEEDADFAFVTNVHRAPADEDAGYALHVGLDLFAPGQHFRLHFESIRALRCVYRALQHLLDDADTSNLPIAVGCGALFVRLFSSQDDDDDDDEEQSSF